MKLQHFQVYYFMLIKFLVIVIPSKEFLMFMWWQLLYINKKTIQNSWKSEIFPKKIFLDFFSKSWIGGEFTKLRPETESRNRGNHKLWNHEMRGSPVVNKSSCNPIQELVLSKHVSREKFVGVTQDLDLFCSFSFFNKSRLRLTVYKDVTCFWQVSWTAHEF